MVEEHPGSENLRPWQPGESGNPTGGSRRQSARAVAKRIGGLAPALREMLDSAPPAELLAELSDEQRAALDGSETLARFLGAKLLTAAASATTLNQLLQSLALIAQIDSKSGALLGGGNPLEDMLEGFPPYLAVPLERALEAFQNGADPQAEFHRYFDRLLSEDQNVRMHRAVMGDIDLRNFPPSELARFTERLPDEDRQHLSRIHSVIESSLATALEALSDDDRDRLDRIHTELRSGPIDDRIEKFMNGELSGPL